MIPRLLCALLGHVEGGDILFSYFHPGPLLGQRPDLRGPTRIRVLGRECPRCGALLPTEMREKIAAARELVEGMTGSADSA